MESPRLSTEDADNLATSLVREFLSRKGLTNTLTALDQESPRTSNSISNRVQLAKSIGVEKLMRKNKESDTPYRSILEVVTANLAEKTKKKGETESVKTKSKGEETESLKTKSNGESEDMYKRMKDEEKSGKSPVPKPSSDDLVLEDTEEGETFLGEGHVANQRPDSGHVTGNQRTTKARQGQGRITSNLDSKEQEKLKRALNKPRYMLDDDKNGADQNSTNFSSDSKLGSTKSPNSSRIGSASNRDSPEPKPRENSAGSQNKTKPGVDVRKIFQETQDSKQERVPSPKPRSSKDKPSTPERQVDEKIDKKKPKNKAELLAMLDMEDPNSMGPNAVKLSKNETKDDPSKLGDLELDDIDDEELAEAEEVRLPPPQMATSRKYQSIPIDLKTAQELKIIIFGTKMQQFYEEWKNQSFAFSTKPDVKYGIVQKKGGPCGVLASVQACFFQHLLFGANRHEPPKRRLNPSRTERTEALIQAIVTILWRCGFQKPGVQSATIALPGSREFFSGSNKFKADGLTEKLLLTEIDDLNDLNQFIRSNIGMFEHESSPGVVLLLYSAILSRSVERIRSDMDVSDGQLMGQHFYCTQEMVNLLLTGRATSNVFNGIMEFGDDENATVAKGLEKRSDIGFMTLFEHFKCVEVGTFYKTPRYPIWVVCCESHYSVLFATKMELTSDWKAERHFDIYYYDGLGCQDEEIRLTVDTSDRFWEPPADEDLVPPLENCIRTKWPEAFVDWNGTEPLL